MTIFYPATTRQSLRPGLIHHSAGRNRCHLIRRCRLCGMQSLCIAPTRVGSFPAQIAKMLDKLLDVRFVLAGIGDEDFRREHPWAVYLPAQYEPKPSHRAFKP